MMPWAPVVLAAVGCAYVGLLVVLCLGGMVWAVSGGGL